MENGAEYHNKDFGFDSNSLKVEPGGSFTQEIPLEFLDYKLTEGIYRIAKVFYNDSEKIIIAAEFEIKE